MIALSQAFASSFVWDRKKGEGSVCVGGCVGGGGRGESACTGGYMGVRADRPDSVLSLQIGLVFIL